MTKKLTKPDALKVQCAAAANRMRVKIIFDRGEFAFILKNQGGEVLSQPLDSWEAVAAWLNDEHERRENIYVGYPTCRNTLQ